MTELVLLSLDRYAFEAVHRRFCKGDDEAGREIAGIWDEYSDRDLECFLCGNTAEQPPFTLTLPERDQPEKIIAAPLCCRCRDLPQMVRLHRATALLRKMWSRGGKQHHFTFGGTRR